MHARAVGKVGQNVKYDDVSMLAAYDIDVMPVIADTRLERKMQDPNAAADLPTLAEQVGMGGHKEEAEVHLDAICKELNAQANPLPALTPKGKVRKLRQAAFHVPQSTLGQIALGISARAFAFGYMPKEVLHRYNARDVWSTRTVLRDEMRTRPRHVRRMWNEITRDANQAVRWIEYWGLACDKSAAEAFSTYCRMHIDSAQSKILGIAGPDFNPASPKQLEVLLFDKLKLRSSKRTDSGARSTDADVLDTLEGKHPIVDALIQFRKYSKLDGTYASGMIRHVRDDGRVHPSFLLDGTETGRLSCQDPNLQNIPRAKGDEDAKYARNCFMAPPGYLLLELDFSQIELRVAAMLSRDEAMIADFRRGIDIHQNNARACCKIAWGIDQRDWDSWDKEKQDPYRSKIKTATFGRLYGKHPRVLAREWGVSVEEVTAIDRTIWGKYHVLDAWTKTCVKEARRTGVCWTYWKGEQALCRPIPKIADPDDGIREHAERQSYNTPVQGTSALYTNASLWPLVETIRKKKLPAKLVCTVHDSIIFEVRKDALMEMAGEARRIMTGHDSSGVPFNVDAKYGDAWGNLETLRE